MSDQPLHEIRAYYDATSIVVYQAYRPEIALPAVQHNRFVPPFSLDRMTWIKPSFLWMMERSNWGQKPGQEHILAVRITRHGWEDALAQAVLTTFEPTIYRDNDDWRRQLDAAPARVQWDPERTLRGATLPYRSIQVGLSRHIIQRYVNEWTVEIRDITLLVHKLSTLIQSGNASAAQDLLPRERVYPLPDPIARRLAMR
ncbi:MAG: DUF4291 domain-containing protein [Ktedonobacterales bacterium]